jgi:hypothetical protein
MATSDDTFELDADAEAELLLHWLKRIAVS